MIMKWIVITLLCGMVAASAAPSEPPKPTGNRYLLVVDTSSAMGKLEHGGRQAVFDLIHSGLQEMMRPGDTFGVWTFQEEVYAGVFPIQVWNPAERVALASRVGTFLKGHPYKGKARLDAAFSRVMTLVRGVKDVNIIFVCSPNAQTKDLGPFPAWEQQAPRAKKAKKPVIIGMAALDGQIAHRSIVIEGDPLDLPVPPPQLAITNSPPLIVITNAAPKVARAPIIMQGPQKPQPGEAPANTNAVAEAPPATNNVAVAQTDTPARPEAPSAHHDTVPAAPIDPPALTALLPSDIPVAAREKSIATPAPQPMRRASALSPTALVLAGSGLLAVGLTLGTWMLISSRRGPQLSSISQSMNRVRVTQGATREA